MLLRLAPVVSSSVVRVAIAWGAGGARFARGQVVFAITVAAGLAVAAFAGS